MDEILQGFHPSPRFGEVSFASYRPDPKQPSQAAAVASLKRFGESVDHQQPTGLRRFFGGRKQADNVTAR